MKFNVAKCHSVRVKRHSPLKQIKYSYILLNQTLEQVTSAKYLGITITDKLDWGQHVSEVSTKATQTLSFLCQNLALAPRETKDMAYKTLVHLKLEYPSPVWNPYIKSQVNQLEKVQRTTARWTCRRWQNTSHVGDMLSELEWPTLEEWHEQALLAFFHKIHSGTFAFERNKYLTPTPRLRQTRVSHELKYTRYFTQMP